jgi:hypothetical protein
VQQREHPIFPVIQKSPLRNAGNSQTLNCNSLHKQGSRISAHRIIEHGIKTTMELTTYISIELPNEAGEVVVLEIPWQQHRPKDMRIPNYEAIASGAP